MTTVAPGPPTLPGGSPNPTGAVPRPALAIGTTGTTGTSDAGQVAWDPGHYYVHVTVSDPEVSQAHAGQPSQAWKGDSVSFEIGRWLDRVPTTVLEPQDSRVIIGPAPPSGAVLARSVAHAGSLVAAPAPTGAEYRVVPP